ncbi:hypothetical protein J4405_04275 [Candidatus Woesearchaeota archaeon]|nr:hypothetical protein [Candidatus Woesearchaeota archaeon]
MAKILFKKLCVKCKKYYLPDGSKMSQHGYCPNCRISKYKCRFINDFGYQCQNNPQFLGYCIHHFVSSPVKVLSQELKKDKL